MTQASPLRLSDISYDGDLRGGVSDHIARAEVSVLDDYLAEARTLAQARPRLLPDDAATGLEPDAEALRWFDLPAACLS
jgi:hypothetical protein